MSNVTSIHGELGGTDGAPLPPKSRRRRAKGPMQMLRESGPYDGFTTLDVINGLHGVCFAADQIVQAQSDIDIAQELNMATKILSSILAGRVEI